jgi:uncharacterized protein YegJ (DUF2314 family)
VLWDIIKKTMSKISTLLIIMILLSACSSQNRSKKWDRENVKLVDKSDSSYINAVQSAQKHLPEFIILLKEREINNYKFNISANYTEEGHTEQLWFMADSFKDNIFYVKLNNVPLHFKKLKLNDKLEIHQDRVKDWLVSKNHKVIAGNFAKADLN